MRGLSDAGQAILCTIHQPSSTLFEQFDRVLLLKKGGQSVYFGDIGENSRTILNYFESQGARNVIHMKILQSIFWNVLELAATAKVDRDWYEVWISSNEYRNLCNEVNGLQANHTLPAVPVQNDNKELSRKFAAGYFIQFKHVYIRTVMQLWRSPTYVYSKLLVMVVVGFIHWVYVLEK